MSFLSLPLSEVWIHATGLTALALNVASLVHRCERALRIHASVAGLIWALNNLLIGSHTAAAMSVLSASRTATSAATLAGCQRRRRWAFLAFCALTVVVGTVTWHGWPSVLMIGASLLSTVSMFYFRGTRLRLVMLVVSALWMYNAWLYDSLEQMAANVATAVAALYGAWRAGREAKTVERAALPAPAAQVSAA